MPLLLVVSLRSLDSRLPVSSTNVLFTEPSRVVFWSPVKLLGVAVVVDELLSVRDEFEEEFPADKDKDEIVVDELSTDNSVVDGVEDELSCDDEEDEASPGDRVVKLPAGSIVDVAFDELVGDIVERSGEGIVDELLEFPVPFDEFSIEEGVVVRVVLLSEEDDEFPCISKLGTLDFSTVGSVEFAGLVFVSFIPFFVQIHLIIKFY